MLDLIGIHTHNRNLRPSEGFLSLRKQKILREKTALAILIPLYQIAGFFAIGNQRLVWKFQTDRRPFCWFFSSFSAVEDRHIAFLSVAVIPVLVLIGHIVSHHVCCES